MVPHVRAREIADKDHLERISRQIRDLGIDEVFVIRGDGEKKGIYNNSSQILVELAKAGIGLNKVGIAGYPEGIPGMTSEQLLEGIRARSKIANEMGAQLYLVTQMCFDPDLISSYVRNLRQNGIDIPVTVGLPAPEKRGNLYETAVRCRVGNSKEKILEDGRENEEFPPDKLVDDIAIADSNGHILGYHIYSFNRVKRLRKWFDDLEKV